MTINIRQQSNAVKIDMCREYGKDRANGRCYKKESGEKRDRGRRANDTSEAIEQ